MDDIPFAKSSNASERPRVASCPTTLILAGPLRGRARAMKRTGTPTTEFRETVAFFRDVLGLPLEKSKRRPVMDQIVETVLRAYRPGRVRTAIQVRWSRISGALEQPAAPAVTYRSVRS
jgi:hypothetical protein